VGRAKLSGSGRVLQGPRPLDPRRSLHNSDGAMQKVPKKRGTYKKRGG
jgi:hypothetical protein